MSTSKTFRLSIIISLAVIALTFSPILFASGAVETKLISEQFVIEASAPEILGDADFSLTEDNDFVFGIPEEYSVGTTTDTAEYHLEVWCTNRTEVYILDSTGGLASDYLQYEQNFVGDAPTTYDYLVLCDGYIEFDFYDPFINPKLIIFSDGRPVNGSFYFSEDLAYVTYEPHHIVSKGSDKATQDHIQIFNVNATISAYLLSEEQYNNYLPDPAVNPVAPPGHSEVLLYNESQINMEFYFTAPAEDYTHLILWHEEYTGVVTGNIYWGYTYERTFMESYWSLLLVVLLIIIMVLFFVFQKQALPPVVWTANKLKHYLISIPWKYVKITAGELRDELVCIWVKLRGIDLDEDLLETSSEHNQVLVIFQALIGFLGLQRYMVGKISTGIVFTFTLGFFGFGYLIDLLAVFFGCFRDSEGKVVNKRK
ncbi:MAG: hypothetical protein ACTSO7_01095 [Candidatus Heimdallarchaeota archaeon]